MRCREDEIDHHTQRHAQLQCPVWRCVYDRLIAGHEKKLLGVGGSGDAGGIPIDVGAGGAASVDQVNNLVITGCLFDQLAGFGDLGVAAQRLPVDAEIEGHGLQFFCVEVGDELLAQLAGRRLCLLVASAHVVKSLAFSARKTRRVMGCELRVTSMRSPAGASLRATSPARSNTKSSSARHRGCRRRSRGVPARRA